MRTDGTVGFGFRIAILSHGPLFSIGWLIAHSANVLRVVNKIPKAASQPETEYAFEMQLAMCRGSETRVKLMEFGGTDYAVGAISLSQPIKLHRLSYGPDSEADALLNILVADLHNLFGGNWADNDLLVFSD